MKFWLKSDPFLQVLDDSDDQSLSEIVGSGGDKVKKNSKKSRRRRHKNRRSKNNPDRRRNRKSKKGSKGKNKKGNKGSLCPALQNTPTMKLFGLANTNQTKFSTGEVTVVCGGGYGLNLKNRTVKCVRGRWRPHTPRCIPRKWIDTHIWVYIPLVMMQNWFVPFLNIYSEM